MTVDDGAVRREYPLRSIIWPAQSLASRLLTNRGAYAHPSQGAPFAGRFYPRSSSAHGAAVHKEAWMTVSLWLDAHPLALASKSVGRRRVLEQAGVPFDVFPADVDERAIEAEIAAQGGDVDRIAQELAAQKCRAASRAHPDRLTLGADQIASCAGRRFGKPQNRDAAAAQLAFLSGRAHRLHSAIALARGGEILFQCVAHADLTMRDLSPAFIEAYLDAAGGSVETSAGAYQIENFGAHLFAKVEGDQWTIMGLPLLETLEALRRVGALRA
jgi:septum formation protein